MSCELPELSFSHEIHVCSDCSWQCLAEHARHVKLHAVACMMWCLPNLLSAVCYLLALVSSLKLELGRSPFNWLCTRNKAASVSTSEAEEEQQAQWVSCWSPHTQASEQKGEWLVSLLSCKGCTFVWTLQTHALVHVVI